MTRTDSFEPQTEPASPQSSSSAVDQKVILQAMFIPVFIERPADSVKFVSAAPRASAADVPTYDRVKRATEIAVVVLCAPLWLPLCLFIGLLVWLEDKASPLFFQARIGRSGKPFHMIKFRTMVPNAGEVLREQLMADDGFRRDWQARYKLKDDPRTTRIGKILRRLSLDELPQLINVLIGEMSLIGPRPLPRYHHQRLSQATRVYRERVLPGLTGLWQVSARDRLDNTGMELWDPYYVRNRSLLLDLSIVFRTLRVVLRGNGAF